VNERLTWGGVVAIAGGLAVAVASFLPQAWDLAFFTGGAAGNGSLWHRQSLLNLFAVCVIGVTAALSAAVAAPDEQRGVLGLRWDQWASALGLVCFVSSVLSLISWQSSRWGAYALVLAAALLLVGTVGRLFLPVLRSPVAASATPAMNAQRYWVAVPSERTIYRPDAPASPAGTLNAGEWHLVLGQASGGLLVRSSQGMHGVLYDIQGLIRG
jgi:hypothetical protein